MSKKSASEVIQDWAGVVSVLGFCVLLLGGWTSLNTRITANETDIGAVKTDTSHTRDRVDKIYDYLLEDK